MHEENVFEWMKFAKMDLDTAIHIEATMRPKPLEIICYHCQQSAEKYLKATFVYFQKPIEKTHDLTFLAEVLQDSIDVSDDIYRACAALTKYGVKACYPFQLVTSQNDVSFAIANAKRIQYWVESLVKQFP